MAPWTDRDSLKRDLQEANQVQKTKMKTYHNTSLRRNFLIPDNNYRVEHSYLYSHWGVLFLYSDSLKVESLVRGDKLLFTLSASSLQATEA